MFRLLCLGLGYAIGCIQTAFIVGKLMGNIDIREFGSGNAGTTNIVRVMGTKFGAIVFACDILKGAAAFLICSALFGGDSAFWGGKDIVPGMYAALGVILGHDFPFYLRFKGGKGIASTLGVILCIDWRVALLTYLVGIICVVPTRYISLASLGMTAAVVVLMCIFGFPPEAVIVMAMLTALAYYQHSANIGRLIAGTENKFRFKK